jgi:hypothetical protein
MEGTESGKLNLALGPLRQYTAAVLGLPCCGKSRRLSWPNYLKLEIGVGERKTRVKRSDKDKT